MCRHQRDPCAAAPRRRAPHQMRRHDTAHPTQARRRGTAIPTRRLTRSCRASATVTAPWGAATTGPAGGGWRVRREERRASAAPRGRRQPLRQMPLKNHGLAHDSRMEPQALSYSSSVVSSVGHDGGGARAHTATHNEGVSDQSVHSPPVQMSGRGVSYKLDGTKCTKSNITSVCCQGTLALLSLLAGADGVACPLIRARRPLRHPLLRAAGPPRPCNRHRPAPHSRCCPAPHSRRCLADRKSVV